MFKKKQFNKTNMASFHNLNTTAPKSECIAACIALLKELHADFERTHNDQLKMDHPLWFADLDNYEPGDESVELLEKLLDLKENVTLRRVDKDVFAYL